MYVYVCVCVYTHMQQNSGILKEHITLKHSEFSIYQGDKLLLYKTVPY